MLRRTAALAEAGPIVQTIFVFGITNSFLKEDPKRGQGSSSFCLVGKNKKTNGQDDPDRVQRDHVRYEIGISHQKDADHERLKARLFLSVHESDEPDASEKDPRDKAGRRKQKFSSWLEKGDPSPG